MIPIKNEREIEKMRELALQRVEDAFEADIGLLEVQDRRVRPVRSIEDGDADDLDRVLAARHARSPRA